MSYGQKTRAKALAVGMARVELVVRVLTAVGTRVGMPPGNEREIVDNTPLGEVLGKPGDTATELRDILRPVGIARDVLRSLSVPDNDSIGELRDSVCKLRDGISELRIRVVRPELRDAAGKVTDALGTFDNELSYGKSADRAVMIKEGYLHTCVIGRLVSGIPSVTDGVFDTGGIVTLAVSPGKLSVGEEKDVVSASKLNETEVAGSETSETEPVAKEDSVGKLPVGSSVVLSDKSSEDKVDKSPPENEVPPNSILEKLVVNTLARSLVGIPPGVIEPGVECPGAVTLAEIEGAEKLPVKISEEKEGRSGDRLVDSPFEGREMFPVDNVGSTEPMSDALSDESPG